MNVKFILNNKEKTKTKTKIYKLHWIGEPEKKMNLGFVN
jgi:hypothetical protein